MYFWKISFIQNNNENISKYLEVRPEIVCSFLGASWKLFGLPGDLVSNIINKEGYWKPKKRPESPQEATKISGQKSRNIFVGILDETDFEINWPLQLMKYISNNFRYSSPMYCRRLPIQNLLQKYAHQSRHLRMVLSIIQESYSYVLCMLCFSIGKTFRMCACLSVVVRNYQTSFHVKEKKGVLILLHIYDCFMSLCLFCIFI